MCISRLRNGTDGAKDPTSAEGNKRRIPKKRACIIPKTEENWIYGNGSVLQFEDLEGQANKSARGMPWHQEPKKDVTSCEKLRGGANIQRSEDIRMGKPAGAILRHPALKQIGVGREPPELKHLSRARKRHQPRFRQ